MRSTTHAVEKRLGESGELTARQTRAITGSMTILVPQSDPASGHFLVSGESGDTHVVDLAANTCTCKDSEYRLPDALGEAVLDTNTEICKHRWRCVVALLGIDAVSEHMVAEVDRCLVNTAAAFADLDASERVALTVEEKAARAVEPVEVDTDESESGEPRAGTEPARLVVPDGGAVVSAAEPLESSDGDEPACVCELDPDGLGCFEHFEGSGR